MADFIAILAIVLIVGGAVRHLYKAKKNGVTCVGCSEAGCCSKYNDDLADMPAEKKEESSCCCCSSTEEKK